MPGANGLSGMLATMTAPPLFINTEFAAQIARDHYGIEGEVQRLTGERDENFRLHSPNADYVLKIAPAAEDPLVTDLSTAALLHLARQDPSLPCPRVLFDRAGNAQIRIADESGQLRTGRLLTWLPGVPLRSTGTSAAQQAGSARMAARTGRALANFRHPAAHRELIWDIRVLPELLPLLDELPDFPRRDWVAARMAQFRTDVLPCLRALRQQVIHNDFNDRNVLVNPADPAQLTGIIDYGDMVHAPLIFDLAILAAAQVDDPAALEMTLARLTNAYSEVEPLVAAETQLLRRLVAARILMGAVIPCWHRRNNPESGHYARVTPYYVRGRLAIAETLFAE